jgi:hypothetical protein
MGDGNPLEGYVYKMHREQMISICLGINKQNRDSRLEEVRRWYDKADWARANKQPEPPQPDPPQPELYVEGPAEGVNQSAIVIRFGKPVADPAPLVLAEIPSYLVGRYPPNVTAISGITSDGGVLTCFPEDTRPTGWKETYKGVVGIKVEGLGFGNNRKSFYNVVGPAA